MCSHSFESISVPRPSFENTSPSRPSSMVTRLFFGKGAVPSCDASEGFSRLGLPRKPFPGRLHIMSWDRRADVPGRGVNTRGITSDLAAISAETAVHQRPTPSPPGPRRCSALRRLSRANVPLQLRGTSQSRWRLQGLARPSSARLSSQPLKRVSVPLRG
jgi:hypothetical protein